MVCCFQRRLLVFIPSHYRRQRCAIVHMTKPVLSHAGSLAIHVGRAMVVRHVPGVHGPHLYTGAGDACGVWHAGMHVCPREAEEVAGLDD